MFFNRKSISSISEYVSSGHPDKLADQISDALLDAYIMKDRNAFTAIECLITGTDLIVAGEVSNKDLLSLDEIRQVVHRVLKNAGYCLNIFDFEKINIQIILNKQSKEIENSVKKSDSSERIEGAGDQCAVFGFATNETPSYMPAPIYFSKAIIDNVLSAVKTKAIPFVLGPDGKSQVVVEYKKGIPVGINHALLSIQHPNNVSREEVREAVLSYILSSFPAKWNVDPNKIIINPSSSFVIGGPAADCGLTGRKTAVDTYGSYYYNGGGAFSGKDSSKLDRSGAYVARYIAKNIVAAGLAKSCGVQIGYAIGIKNPIFFYIDTFGTNTIEEEKITNLILEHVPLDPQGIVDYFGLQRPIYERTAVHGHFGIEPDTDGGYSWEKIDLAESLMQTSLSKKLSINILPFGNKVGNTVQ